MAGKLKMVVGEFGAFVPAEVAQVMLDACIEMLILEERRMYERDPDPDARPRPCPCPGCGRLRAAVATAEGRDDAGAAGG